MRSIQPTKGDKREVRQETHLTRPPRLEGVVKEAMMQPTRKRKARHAPKPEQKKQRWKNAEKRRNYQLKSRYHKPTL